MGRPAKYPPEFQREAVELVLGLGRSINEVALSLGIKRGTLGNWVKAARDARDRDADPAGLNESDTLRAAATATGERRAASRPRDPAQGSRLLRPRDDAVIRFRFVSDHRGVYDVKRMCALVEGRSRSARAPGEHHREVPERADQPPARLRRLALVGGRRRAQAGGACAQRGARAREELKGRDPFGPRRRRQHTRRDVAEVLLDDEGGVLDASLPLGTARSDHVSKPRHRR